MSYILSRGTKGRPPRRPAPTHHVRNTITPTTMRTMPSRSSGGGQVQIQKPQEQDHILKQRVKDTMSMDKVMADLRILEEQQLESERKLKYAQTLKQRRMDGLMQTEQTLHDLQYKNGQMRACIDRHRDTLAINQRRLGHMKLKSRERADDTAAFNDEVNLLHDAMQNLVRACRRHQVYIDLYGKKVGVLRLMVQESRDQVQQLRNELQAMRDRQDALHETIRQESLTEQELTRELSDLRQRILEIEQDITAAIHEQNAHDSKLVNVESEIADETACQQTTSESQAKEIQELQDEVQSLTTKQKALGDTVDLVKKELHGHWGDIVQLQIAEGHPPSLLPSQTNDPPVMDLKMIEDSLAKETSAVQEEKLAETQLRDDVASLEDRLKTCNNEFEEKRVELETKKASIIAELAIEDSRKKNKYKMIEELRNNEKTLADMLSAMKPLQQMAEEDRLARTKQLEEIHVETANAQSTLDVVLAERAKIEERAAISADASAEEMAVLQAAIADEKKRSEKIDMSIRDLEHQCKHNFTVDDVAQRKKDAETANREINRCIEKYPQLEHLEITYRKDLSSSEQIDIDLADLQASVRAKEAELKKLRESKAKKSRTTKDPSSGRSRQANKPTTAKSSSKNPTGSVAKPQSLLQKFVQASQEEESEDEIPFDDASKSTMESLSEKRVRWQDATIGSDDVTERTHNLNTQLSQSSCHSLGNGKVSQNSDVERSIKPRMSAGKTKSTSTRGVVSSRSLKKSSREAEQRSEHRKGGTSKERSQVRPRDGKRSAIKHSTGEQRTPFAESSQNRKEKTGTANRPRSTSSKSTGGQKTSRSGVHKHSSAHKDPKPAKAVSEHRNRSSQSKKILKRPRGHDDSSVATKRTKRSFSQQASGLDKDHTLSQTTQDSKKRRRRPKNKSSSLFKDGMPEISFA